ncbi:hypothetical protein G8V06_09220 [Clostridium botulinum D/C]|nr:hypothetical protein [Clostridium botulinum]MCD3234272.1 hypothetical protein [Clostridium botulinum D/C]MCD3240330.1 hypothetical protein [Clostridium botulinum D/C]MCD3267691.1 hypothetical protein [Clostridium botulinum D/C]MCD3306162.1 hypothetical protein [Clostridium botulinum D/C]MCD3314872.1 hypothetical protein [Clostridium botulinum D/C]
MINYLIKSLINTYIPKQKYSVEELLYDKEVYPQYIATKGNFNYAMRNRLLNREDILQIKSMLNKALFKNRHLKDFRYKKFENDAHEIYTKLKSKYLSRKQLIKIDKFISRIVSTKQRTISSSTISQISQS